MEYVKHDLKKCIHSHTVRTHPACFYKDRDVKPENWTPKPQWVEDKRIGFFDIETSSFNADFGFMYSYCIKVQGKKKIYKWLITPEEIRGGKFDKSGIKQLTKDLRNFDVIVTWYGDRFDLPFIRTRSIIHRLPFPVYRELISFDLWKTARSKLKMSRNSLDNVTRKFNVDTRKTYFDSFVWLRAHTGHQPSLNKIMKHNIPDVVALEEVYDLIESHMTKARRSL